MMGVRFTGHHDFDATGKRIVGLKSVERLMDMGWSDEPQPSQ